MCILKKKRKMFQSGQNPDCSHSRLGVDGFFLGVGGGGGEGAVQFYNRWQF